MNIKEALAKLGIRQYSPSEVKEKYTKILETIKSPAKNHHDVIDTKINLVSHEEWAKVLPGKAIACAFAGTNWVVGIVEKKGSENLTTKYLRTRNMSDAPKKNNSQGLAKLMATEINTAAIENKINISEIIAIGIAFGFSQINLRVNGGIDARLRPLKWKGWHFVGKELSLPPGSRPSLGNLLVENLKTINNQWSVKYFAFKNDTQAVAEDGQSMKGYVLPIGLVFGTGMNGALKTINLRLAAIPTKADLIMAKMVELGFVLNNNYYQESLVGGDHIRRRVGITIHLLAEMGIISNENGVSKIIIENKDGGLISKIAGATGVKEISKTLGIDLNSSEIAPILKLACNTALTQAGQLIGMNIAAVAVAAGYNGHDKAVVPVEGSVYWKGYGVKEAAKETIHQILPGNKLTPKEAVGLRGVGKVALTQTLY